MKNLTHRSLLIPHAAQPVLRFSLITSALLVFLVITLGGVIRVTGSTGVCSDWPTCLGRWSPPTQSTTLLDYAHRALTALAVMPLLSSVIVAYQHLPSSSMLRRLLLLALAIYLGQVGIGATLSLDTLSLQKSWSSLAHLALSLIVEALLLKATVEFFSINRSSSFRMAETSQGFRRLSWMTLFVLFVVFSSGALQRVITPLSPGQVSPLCAAWPFCNELSLPVSPAGWLQLLHRVFVLAGTILTAYLAARAWNERKEDVVILVSTTVTAVFFFAQALLGVRLLDQPPLFLLGLHQATAVATWVAMVVQLSAQSARPVAGQGVETAEPKRSSRKGILKDLLLLTKPIVVLLLLVTTYAGMVIGAQSWPSAALTFWTLLGGFMAAGGSGAINQYIDRLDDAKMQRTQKRPIPAGRLTPAEGLAFGTGLAITSFFLMVAFVNFLAALLTLAGIIYYVLIYSICLKKISVQNIVIGGGAGAIPPLVGWAAATGSLNIPSLLLFAVVFLWTPPHFWALALVRRHDYARAGVPMLPVVRGEKTTRWQILIYTVELVCLTLFLPAFGLGGGIYLAGAAMLGGWLLLAAWKVWRQEGNKVSWKMYRFSSMYLAFLFLVLMVDRII